MTQMTARAGTAVGYARRSKREEGNTASVDRQQEDIRELAERLGVTLDRIYVDNGVSGWGKRGGSTGWAQMLRDLKADPPEYVLIWKGDRLSRRLGDVELIDDLHKSAGLKLWSTAEGDVFRGPWPIIFGIAKWSSEETSYRVRRAQESRRKKGLPVNGGKRPYGYTQNRMALVPAEVAVLHHVAERIIGGETLTGVSRDLNARGILTATGGGNWNSTTLSRILRNPRYIGQVNRGRAEAMGPAAWPRVFDDATWEALQARLGEMHATGHGNPTGTSLLGGLARCGRCSSKMTSDRKVYRCNKNAGGCGRVQRDKTMLDNYVTGWLLDHFSAEVVTDRASRAATAASLAQRVYNAAAWKMDDLETAYVEGRVEPGRYWPLRDRLQAQLVKARTALAEARTAEQVANGDGLARDLWEGWSLGEQRRWLRQRLAAVVVLPPGKGALGHRIDPEKVRIELR